MGRGAMGPGAGSAFPTDTERVRPRLFTCTQRESDVMLDTIEPSLQDSFRVYEQPDLLNETCSDRI